jgi:hypothetical protein
MTKRTTMKKRRKKKRRGLVMMRVANRVKMRLLKLVLIWMKKNMRIRYTKTKVLLVIFVNHKNSLMATYLTYRPSTILHLNRSCFRKI